MKITLEEVTELIRKDDGEELNELKKKGGKVKKTIEYIEEVSGEMEMIADKLDASPLPGQGEKEEDEITVEMVRKAMGRA